MGWRDKEKQKISWDGETKKNKKSHGMARQRKTKISWDGETKKNKKSVDLGCPFVISTYNRYMGVVDLAGVFLSYYRIPSRSEKGIATSSGIF